MTNTQATPILLPTPELLGSLASTFKDSAVAEFTSTPNAFLKKLGFEIDAEIKLINNEADVVNIALPFYSNVEKTAGAMLSDEDLETVSGSYGSLAVSALNNLRVLRDAMYNAETPEETAAATETFMEAQDEFILGMPGGLFMITML